MATEPTAIHVEVLPARLGDCLLVECLRPEGPTWRMLVDGGPPDTWPLLEARLRRLDPGDRHIDVAVITHIDSDHIGGMLPFLASDLAADVRDFWFNGRTHLPVTGPGRPRSVVQGESLVAALRGADGDPLAGGPTVTVLSPTTKRLTRLADAWSRSLRAALGDHDREVGLDVPEPLDDLQHLADGRTPRDSSVPNGSSIALLVEHRGASVVLGADAFGSVLTAALQGVARARGGETLTVDALKLPHHGSDANVVAALLEVAPASHYLVSTNGDVFHHPDDAAMARVVLGAPAGPTLWFNYRTPRTERWADPRLVETHGHRVAFPEPGHAGAGAVIDLPARR